MLKNLIQITGIALIIFAISEATESKQDDKVNLELGKRALLEKERQYLKTQPMSKDLRNFIERYRRKNNKEKRQKRSGNIEENLYFLQDGKLVPFKSMKDDNKRSETASKEKVNDADSFTVVPLVIPLQAHKELTENKLLKTRNLNEESVEETKSEVAPSGSSPPSPVATAISGNSTKSVPQQQLNEASLDNVDDANNTKEEQEVLNKILHDVEGLMLTTHEGGKKEGVLCNLNGSWVSEAAGMRFDICYKDSTRKKFRIHVSDRIPPNEEGFLCDGNWTLFGELPFVHSGVIIALAVHQKDKHIATFIGECRVCEGSETVTGTWLIGRSSRDCKDQKASHKILSDVWKREHCHELRKKHLESLGVTNIKED